MEIIPLIILCDLECDVEEENTFEVRKHSSSYPLELNSAQRKKVTFWTSVHTLVPVFPISYEYLIHSELYTPMTFREAQSYFQFIHFYLPVWQSMGKQIWEPGILAEESKDLNGKIFQL